MVFWETSGENDFRSLFPTYAEKAKEDEERKQTEMFLRILDDLESRSEDRTSGKENLKVSITDPERAKEESKLEEVKEKQQKKALHGKVHTLDDLPPDEMDFISLFGIPPAPEPPEVSIEAGRRLSDGKIKYNAKIPSFSLSESLGIGSFFGFPGSSIDLETVILGFFIILIIGILIGKWTSSSRHKKEIGAIHKKHSMEIQALQEQVRLLSTHQQKQPMYMMMVPPVQTPAAVSTANESNKD